MRLNRLLPAFAFNSASMARLNRIKSKQLARTQRIKEAYDYMHEWNDIPISQLAGSLCEILKIKRNQAAMNLFYRMNMDLGPDEVEKIIPLQ